MQRARVLSAIALVLAVVALGTVAGGLAGDSNSDGEPSPGLGVGSGEGSGIGESDGVGIRASEEDPPMLPTWLGFGPFLLVLWISLLAGVIAVLLYVWEASPREFLAALRDTLGTVAAIGVALGLIVALLLLLSGLFDAGGGGFLGSSGVQNDGMFGDATTTNSTSLLAGLVILAGVVLLGLFVVLLLPDGQDDDGDGTVEEPPTEDESGGTTRNGVRPAADLENPDASNEVFRAWATLRDRVGRPNRTESPEELRRRAIDAGLDERAVTELTALFNATRYGQRPVTDREARRAREAVDSLDGSGGES